MRKDIIFVFSGTGNSLWAAKKISEELENCGIVSMGCLFAPISTTANPPKGRPLEVM